MTGDLDVLARLDLAELAASYAAAVDGREWDRLGALFTHDAVLLGPDLPRSLAPVIASEGREAIVAAAQGLTSFAATFHHLTGSIWTADGEAGAMGRTTAIAHHVEMPKDDAQESRSWVWHVVYEDRCLRTDSGWMFTRRALTVRMIEARPIARVLPFDDSDAT